MYPVDRALRASLCVLGLVLACQPAAPPAGAPAAPPAAPPVSAPAAAPAAAPPATASLSGRTFAKLTPCDSSDPPLARGFERGGYTRDEVNVVYMGLPDMNVALANKAVDAAWQIEPLSTLGQERGIASKFAPGDELYPNQQIAVLFYSPEFARRTDAARAFMIAYVRGLRDYNDAFRKGIGRADIAQILAKYTTVKDLALYDRITPAGLDPDGRMNVQGVR